MPQRRVYALCKGTVIADRALAELLSGIFVEPLLSKGFEFDMPGADAAAALLLKENICRCSSFSICRSDMPGVGFHVMDGRTCLPETVRPLDALIRYALPRLVYVAIK